MSNRVKIKSAKDILAKANRPERVFPLLMRGDLIARQQELELDLQEIQNEDGFSDPRAIEIAKEIQALETEAEENTLHLRLRALDNTTWRKALADNPSDKDDESSDLEKVFEAVLADSIVDPELDDDDLEALKDAMTHGQRNTLMNMVYNLNGSDNSVPFSRIGSLVRRNFDNEPNSPEDSESASDDSKDGNPEQ